MSLKVILAVSFLSSLLCGAPVWAVCGPLKLVNKLQTVPTKNGNLELVPVSINGNDKYLLLDTGGIATQISPATAKELNLPIKFSRNVHLVDVNGNVVNQVATIGSFTMGRLIGSRMMVPVMSNPRLEAIGASGLISRDLLFGYDVDIDFGSHSLSLFSQDHCEGNVVYWQDAGTGTVPMRVVGGHVVIQVTLDGHQYDAIVDTGSESSIMSQSAAEHDFGPAMNLADDLTSKPVNGDRAAVGHYHAFRKLAFGDVTVLNPRMLVLPDEMGARSLGNTHVSLPKMIIGMNILRHLHTYFAIGEDKLYVSGSAQSRPVETLEPSSVSRIVASNIR